jgi:two-component system LytT family response regulator
VALRAFIVEDEPLARQTIKDFVAGIKWLEVVGETANGYEAVRMIDEVRPDLVFLDVQIPGLTGLQVLERVSHSPAIIFTTAHDSHAVSAFELGALDYLLKPFGRDRFRRALERFRSNFQGADGPGCEASATPVPAIRERLAQVLNGSGPVTRLFVRDQGRIVPLQTSEITRLEANDDYVDLHTVNKTYLVYFTLNAFSARLDPAQFRRVHRSHVVNVEHITSMEPFDRRLLLKMSDGSEVLTSRNGSQQLQDLIA